MLGICVKLKVEDIAGPPVKSLHRRSGNGQVLDRQDTIINSDAIAMSIRAGENKVPIGTVVLDHLAVICCRVGNGSGVDASIAQDLSDNFRVTLSVVHRAAPSSGQFHGRILHADDQPGAVTISLQ